MNIIDSVTIRYFRSVYTLNLSNCKDLNVFSGKNDVGKSNIIKALNLFFNQETDYGKKYCFEDDYSLLRKEEVKKDSIRGQQFISITVSFNRGGRMEKSLPPKFSVTRRWDMHSSNYKESTNVHNNMKRYAEKNGLNYSEKTTNRVLNQFLNQIKYIYIPAIKDESVFNDTLDMLQNVLFSSKRVEALDKPIREANNLLQESVSEIQDDFYTATGIKNNIEIPDTLNFSKGLLRVDTTVDNGIVGIEKHGDGIRVHYIPKILDYIAKNSNKYYIWGFEEPENSYEYLRCLQVAKEFEIQYSKNSQIFITSHSPAFYSHPSEKKEVKYISLRDSKTQIDTSVDSIDEELGVTKIYEKFADDLNELQMKHDNQNQKINELKQQLSEITTPIIFTEGKTDAALLKLAIKKLSLHQFDNWKIQPIKVGNTQNNTELIKFLNSIKTNLDLNQLVIGMFDRDCKIEFDSVDIRTKKFHKIANKIYAFSIPTPHNRAEENEISIEHYFTDKEIKTEKNGKRLFLGNEFQTTGVYKGDEELYYRGAESICSSIKIIEHESKRFVTKYDGSGDYSISKAAFVECIKNDEGEFKNISFNEFSKIFDIIKLIEEDAEGDLDICNE